MRSDSPPPSWYEPPDEIEDDDELADVPHEHLVIGSGAGSWYALLAHDED